MQRNFESGLVELVDVVLVTVAGRSFRRRESLCVMAFPIKMRLPESMPSGMRMYRPSGPIT